MSNSEKELAELARRMGERHPEVALVYLFGSQAAGRPGPLSDFDFAVYLDRDSSIAALRSELAHEAAVALDFDRIDLVVLNEVPVELSFHVIATGRLLFERSIADRVEYEAYVMSRYGDYLPILRAQREEILHGGSDEKRVQRYREALRRTERTLGSGRDNR